MIVNLISSRIEKYYTHFFWLLSAAKDMERGERIVKKKQMFDTTLSTPELSFYKFLLWDCVTFHRATPAASEYSRNIVEIKARARVGRLNEAIRIMSEISENYSMFFTFLTSHLLHEDTTLKR